MAVAPPRRGEKPKGEVGGDAELRPGRDGDGGVDTRSWWGRGGDPNNAVRELGPQERSVAGVAGSLSVGEELQRLRDERRRGRRVSSRSRRVRIGWDFGGADPAGREGRDEDTDVKHED